MVVDEQCRDDAAAINIVEAWRAECDVAIGVLKVNDINEDIEICLAAFGDMRPDEHGVTPTPRQACALHLQCGMRIERTGHGLDSRNVSSTCDILMSRRISCFEVHGVHIRTPAGC